MANIIEQLGDLWNSAKSSPAKSRSYFTIKDIVERPFVEKQHYMQIIINEMYLTKNREWFIKYAPVALIATTHIYGNQEHTTPVIIGPSLFQQYTKEDLPDGIIIRNAPVISLHPYQGGAVTLTAIFSKVEKKNNVDIVLEVLENIAGIASPLAPAIPFASYLKVTGSIMNSVRTLMNLSETVPLIAYRETINPQVGHALLPTYLVLIDADQKEIKKEQFVVIDSRLYYKENGMDAQPYRKHDFLLIQFARGDKRNDERMLPFYELWEQTRDLAAQASDDHFWLQTKEHWNTLKRIMLKSPDLTRPDYKRFKVEYLAEITELRNEAVDEAQMGPGDKLADDEQELRDTAHELDELDEL